MQCRTHNESYIYISDEMWKFKYKLSEVLKNEDKKLEDKRNIVIAEQIGTDGRRKFALVNLDEFLEFYIKKKEKHYYEVIIQSRLKKLYIDIDVNNKNSNTLDRDEEIWNFIRFLTKKIEDITKIKLEENDWIFLNSSSVDKRSFHAILDHENLRFRDNSSMKTLIMDTVSEFEQLENEPGKEKKDSMKIIDQRCYCKNQNMRLFLSSKMGSNRILKLDERDQKIFKMTEEFETDLTKKLFKSALITEGIERPIIFEDIRNEYRGNEEGKKKEDSKMEKIGFKRHIVEENKWTVDIKRLIKDKLEKEISYSNNKDDNWFLKTYPPMRCPFEKRRHRNNNTYVRVNKKRMIWSVKCMSEECRKKKSAEFWIEGKYLKK